MSLTEDQSSRSVSEQQELNPVDSKGPRLSPETLIQKEVNQVEPGEITESPDEQANTTAVNTEEHDGAGQDQIVYNWCKCFYEPAYPNTQNYYFMRFDTRETQYEEPNQPYWIWVPALNNVDPSGLQYPSTMQEGQVVPATSSTQGSNEPESGYQGYIPSIHGDYDPTAPYAKYHEQKRMEEEAEEAAQEGNGLLSAQHSGYGATGAFNRFTGRFQTAEQAADRHNDANKSKRQLNAFFDADKAANSNEGKSLKAERRKKKHTKDEIQYYKDRRAARTKKKTMDWLRA